MAFGITQLIKIGLGRYPHRVRQLYLAPEQPPTAHLAGRRNAERGRVRPRLAQAPVVEIHGVAAQLGVQGAGVVAEVHAGAFGAALVVGGEQRGLHVVAEIHVRQGRCGHVDAGFAQRVQGLAFGPEGVGHEHLAARQPPRRPHRREAQPQPGVEQVEVVGIGAAHKYGLGLAAELGFLGHPQRVAAVFQLVIFQPELAAGQHVAVFVLEAKPHVRVRAQAQRIGQGQGAVVAAGPGGAQRGNALAGGAAVPAP